MKKFLIIMISLIILVIISVSRCSKEVNLLKESQTDYSSTTTTTTEKKQNTIDLDFVENVKVENVSLGVSPNYELFSDGGKKVIVHIKESELNKPRETRNLLASFTIRGGKTTKIDLLSEERQSIGTYTTTGSDTFVIPYEMNGTKVASANVIIETNEGDLNVKLIRLE